MVQKRLEEGTCLLDTGGKMLEQVIQNRLTELMEGENPLSDSQFDFWKARSTLYPLNLVVSTAKHAIAGKRWKHESIKNCAIITHVKNTFNSAN